MTPNKQTVQRYMEGFMDSDHEKILSCLTDSITWEVPGFFNISGKDAFDREIENENFVGKPMITVTRMTEENEVVVAEGTVRSQKRDGGTLNAVFCDVFEMEREKINRIISYLMEKPASESK